MGERVWLWVRSGVVATVAVCWGCWSDEVLGPIVLGVVAAAMAVIAASVRGES